MQQPRGKDSGAVCMRRQVTPTGGDTNSLRYARPSSTKRDSFIFISTEVLLIPNLFNSLDVAWLAPPDLPGIIVKNYGILLPCGNFSLILLRGKFG